ncbi:MAG: hypothetical protein KJP20_12120 [Bacteroidia bacterium]|nr:hypothetical protein [Bacteroidia bacterium]
MTIIASQEAKRILGNRHDLMGYLPHIDPIRDAMAWHGILWLYLFEVLKYPFPNFLDPQFKDDNNFMWYPTYPSARSQGSRNSTKKKLERVSSTNYGDIWSYFFDDAKLPATKVTSVTRVQAIQMMDDKDVPPHASNRASGHRLQEKTETSAKQNNYLNNVQLSSAVCLAGGDWQNKAAFIKPQASVTFSDDELSAFEIAVHLLSQLPEIINRKASNSRRQNLDQRLYSAHHVCFLMLEEIKAGILMLASRPMDICGVSIERDQPCFYDLFNGSPTLRSLFAHHFFQSHIWSSIKERMRFEENAVESALVKFPPGPRNEMHDFCNRLSKSNQIMHLQFRKMQNEISSELKNISGRRNVAIDNQLSPPLHTELLTPTGVVNETQVVPIRNNVFESRSACGKRKAIRQEFILSAEAPPEKPDDTRINLTELDKHCNSAFDYYCL